MPSRAPLVVAVLVALVVATSADATLTADAAFQWADNGHWYQAFRTDQDNIPWEWANTQAGLQYRSGAQGHLATFATEAENDFVSSQLSTDLWIDRDAGPYGPWIGLSSAGSYVWTWVDGTPLSYTTRWASGQPNTNSASPAWVAFWPGGPTWGDADFADSNGQTNYRHRNFVVEYDGQASAVPEPASCALLALATGGIGAMLKRRRKR